MAVINLTLPEGEYLVTGKQITFEAPCSSENVTGIRINDTDYELVDTIGNPIAPNAFAQGAMVSVIINNVSSKAFIQNPTTNAYIDAQIKKVEAKTKTPRELIDLGGQEDVVLRFDLLKPSNKEYVYDNGSVKLIGFDILQEEGNEIPDDPSTEESISFIENWDYWCLFNIPIKRGSIKGIRELLDNDSIYVLNPDIDLSTYDRVYLLFTTFDGVNIGCIVSGLGVDMYD